MKRGKLGFAVIGLIAAAPATSNDGGHHAGLAEGGEQHPAAQSADHPASTDMEAHGPTALPPFSPELAERPVVAGPQGWAVLADDIGGHALIMAGTAGRQDWRWANARHYVATGRGGEALGMLALMMRDDSDLPLVPAYQLAKGAAQVLAGREAEALATLNMPLLTDNPEACAWRMRILADQGDAQGAMAQLGCAAPALNARHGEERRPFVLAVAHAAMGAGNPAQAIRFLGQLPDNDIEANLLRGRALLKMGKAQEGKLRLARVEHSGDMRQRLDAELSGYEAMVASGLPLPADLPKKLDHLAFVWRGDDLEMRTLQLRYGLAARTQDMHGQLAAGAAMLRYHDMGQEAGPMITTLQGQLDRLFAPDSKVPLQQAAGIFWDFRDIAPNGAAGDAMLGRLATSLQNAGLYERAAELLRYQMTARAQDIEKGPLSIRIATLNILSRRPDLAIRVLRETDNIAYPDDIRFQRLRMQAVALHLLGKDDAARAVVADIPDGAGIVAEIAWQARDWKRVAEAEMATAKGKLTEVDQALVLRRAVALAMLGREEDLAKLRQRYVAAFRGSATASAFDMLTRPVGALNPDLVAKAMAVIPSASPAGALADLFDAGQVHGG